MHGHRTVKLSQAVGPVRREKNHVPTTPHRRRDVAFMLVSRNVEASIRLRAPAIGPHCSKLFDWGAYRERGAWGQWGSGGGGNWIVSGKGYSNPVENVIEISTPHPISGDALHFVQCVENGPQGPRSEAKRNGGISPEDRAPRWACGTQEKATRAALEANHHPHFRLTSPAKSVLGATDHFGDHPSETAADRNMPVLICGLDGEKRFPAAPLRPCQFEPLRSSFPCQTDLALSHERRGDLSRSSAPIRGRPQ